jgi:hypothetical protein
MHDTVSFNISITFGCLIYLGEFQSSIQFHLNFVIFTTNATLTGLSYNITLYIYSTSYYCTGSQDKQFRITRKCSDQFCPSYRYFHKCVQIHIFVWCVHACILRYSGYNRAHLDDFPKKYNRCCRVYSTEKHLYRAGDSE